MKKLLFFISFWSIFALCTQSPHVNAYQAGAFQAGIMNVRDLALPDPGIVFIDYNFWNKSSSYIDRFGNKVKHLTLDFSSVNPELGEVTLDLDQQINGYSNVPVVFYTSKFKLFNARYMASINPVYITSGYRMNIHVKDKNVETSGNPKGFGDLSFSLIFIPNISV